MRRCSKAVPDARNTLRMERMEPAQTAALRSRTGMDFRHYTGAFFAALLLAIGFTTPRISSAQTQPQQAQPSPLTVDRDPAPSPDADAPVAQTAPVAAANGGDVVKGSNGRYTLNAQAYEVRLNASVIDGSGRTIQDLNQAAFHVYEDGVPQTIASFRHEDLPVSIGLLIDNSGSMEEKLSAVDQTALDLVKLSNPQDEEFLVDFNEDAYIDVDFTSSLTKLKQGLSYIEPKGGTAAYDALVAAADYLSKNAKNTKQVLIIITDGEDNASSATLEQAIRRIQDLDGPTIYCIGLLFGEDTSHNEARHAKKVLEELAEETGGQAYFPRSLKDVDPIAAEVAEDIRTQYTIAYRSTNPPSNGGYRQIRVIAKEKGYSHLDVRTRTGYYPRTTPAAAAQVR
jgi:Ca-activated chloride channel family protein